MGRTRSVWGTRDRANLRPRAKCHPDREHKGLGLCPECYASSWGKAQRIKATYNLDWADYCKMYAEQDGKCFLCLKKPRKNLGLVIDHNHTTGKVRKLLCSGCNQAVGLYETRKELLLKIMKYCDADIEKEIVADET